MSATVLGLDIGGSKTHAVLDTTRGTCEALAGSANLASVGAAEAGRQLDAVLDRLDARDVVAVCAGAAGVDTPDGAARLRDLLAQRLPGATIRVVHDSELILAAAGLDAGIAVIAGTGSVAWGRRDDGTTARSGGWGYLLGDEGSGYWVAREAVRHALAGVDRCAPNRLGQQLAADCGLQHPDQLLDHFYAQPDRRYWAGRARLVFELAAGGDGPAQSIVDAAADALADLACSVARRLDHAGPVVLAGGLAVHQPVLQDAVRTRLDAAGCTDVRVLDVDPVRGALTLAHRLSHRPTH